MRRKEQKIILYCFALWIWATKGVNACRIYYLLWHVRQRSEFVFDIIRKLDCASVCGSWQDAHCNFPEKSISSAMVPPPARPTVPSTMTRIPSAASSLDLADIPSLSEASQSQDSQQSVGSSVASSFVAQFSLQPGTFDIVLCADNTEIYGKWVAVRDRAF